MFERLGERAVSLGEARAARRRERLAARLTEIAPAGVRVSREERAVVLEGRAGRPAGALELGWLVAEARDER
jgi:hypothetical protein